MKLLLGKLIAKEIYQQIKKEQDRLRNNPGLAVIFVGKNKASQVYVRLKEKAAKKLGFYFKKYLFPAKVGEKKILKIIQKINKNKKVHGLIVQLPLPKKIESDKIIASILPEKDIDGFHPKTVFISPVHQAVLKLLKLGKIKLNKKKVLILANSLTFAKPLKKLLRKEKARVIIILKPNLMKIKRADIIIIALDRPKFLKDKMIKKGVTIIDIGYSRVGKKALGNVDQKDCQKKAFALSPVPGGVGPLTVAYLMKNVLLAAKKQNP